MKNRPLDRNIPVFITGASSGLGAEFARQCAARGHDLTLTARRTDRLTELAATLRNSYGVGIDTLTADLSQPEGRRAVVEQLQRRSPWILINNAGFGSRGRFADLDPATELNQLAVNVVAVEELTAAVLPGNLDHRKGAVLNVASTAAFQPLPYMATYAATKAFVLSFTEALSAELEGTGVRAMALCPGPIATEFGDVAGSQHAFSPALHISVERCIRTALSALDRGHALCIPGTRNTITTATVRFAPRRFLRAVTSRMLKPND